MPDRYCFLCGTVLTIEISPAEPDVGISRPYIDNVYCPKCGWEPAWGAIDDLRDYIGEFRRDD